MFLNNLKRAINNMKIDFVIAWVDGDDSEWKSKREYWEKKENSNDNNLIINDTREMRYKDWGLLRYWFRTVEKYASWVNHIFFVTDNQIPEWINLDNERLSIVRHEDFIPREYLPTFSSHTIELNFHRIKGLSEYFVYFNDDMFITNYVKKIDFFKNNRPRDCAMLNIKCFDIRETLGFSQLVDTAVINKHFSKKEIILNHLRKWFNIKYGLGCFRTILLLPWKQIPNFYIKHLPTNMLKSTYELLWEEEYKILNIASSHKFRRYTDVNQWLFSVWQIATGNFVPQSPKIGKAFYVGANLKENEKICDAVKNRKYKLLCIGEDETMTNDEFILAKKQLQEAFFYVVQEKSSFER